MGYKRLTNRSPKNGMAYLVNVKPDEQEVDSPYKNTLRCIMDSFNRLAAYEDSGLSPEEVQEFAKAKAEGRLIVPPCKVGDKVYSQAGDPFTVCSININATSRRPKILIRYWASPQNALSELDDLDFWEDDIGKTVFLTPEAAEKALGEANL